MGLNGVDFNNKTILIVGLVIGGLVALYVHQSELACTIFGGLIGYLSKDKITVEDNTMPVVEDIDDEMA